MNGTPSTHRVPLLTAREQHVLSLCAEGLTIPEIAARIGTTPRGAKYFSDTLRHKFGVKYRRELVPIGQAYRKGTE